MSLQDRHVARHSAQRNGFDGSSSGPDDLFLTLARDEGRRRQASASVRNDKRRMSNAAGTYSNSPLDSERISTTPSTYASKRPNHLSASTLYQKTPSPYRRTSLRPAELTYSTANPYDQAISPYSNGVPRQHDPEEVRSEVSIAGQSTVWDELTELKSRMKRLEYGTGQPRVSSTQNGLHERPLTSNTQTTTSSRHSSRGDLLSNTTTRLTSQDPLELHPLLHSALRKVKNVASADVYRALESSAADALSLAAFSRVDTMSDMQSVAGSTLDGESFSQKRVARKADSMCRSLTELCIALCDNAAISPAARTAFRPASRDSALTNGNNSPLAYLAERPRLSERTVHIRPGSSRDPSQSRDAIPARPHYKRTQSVVDGSTSTARPTISRAATTNTYTNSEYARNAYTSRPASPDRDITLRAPSRARTTIEAQTGRSRAATHSPRDLRLSRDYTSRHPLPGTVIPSTPSVPINARKERDAAMTEYTITSASESSDHTERQRDRERPRRSSTSSLRAPPSTGAGLAERLEAKRQQRVAAASQLRGEGMTG